MSKRKAVIGILAGLLALVPLALAEAQVIFEDNFDDGNPLTNTLGIGSSTTRFDPLAPVSEAGGALVVSERTDNNARTSFWTDQTFAVNGAVPVTSSITFTKMERTHSQDANTARWHVGFTAHPVKTSWDTNGGNNWDIADYSAVPPADQRFVPGVWVVFHGRWYDTFGAGLRTAGQGGLFHVSQTGVATMLQGWNWDPTCIWFDTASTFQDHRVPMQLRASDLTVNLTTDATGYTLEFTSTDPTAVVPGTFSGTWVGKGVDISFLSTATYLFHNVGRWTFTTITSAKVQLGTGGEGEGEGEVEPQTEILSNVYPPFIDEGTTVVLTAPPGSGWVWSKDDAEISGATDRQLIFNPVRLTDQGSYRVQYDDGTKVILTTDPFILLVQPEGSVPVAGGIGLAVLLGGCAYAGAVALRRRRR